MSNRDDSTLVEGNDASANNELQQQAAPKPGALLKVARQECGMSVDEVAKALYVTRHKIHALEADEYDKLNSHVFVKGYLRKYATLVALDGDELVRHYEQDVEANAEEESFATTDKDIPRTLVPKFLVPAALFSVAAVVLVVVFISSGGDEPQSQISASAEVDRAIEEREAIASNNSEEPPPAAQSNDEPLQQSTPEAVVAQTPTARPNTPARGPATTAVTNAPERVVANVSIAEPSDNANNAELKFEFSEDCWLEVRDRIDNLLYYDMAKAGENVELQGEPPFSMTLGNAQAVTLYLGDQLINTQPRPGARTAKIVVGESVTQ